MIRDVRRADAPRLFELMERNFPEESALLGNRPEGFEEVVRRVFRWDRRLILGLLRLLGRPIFRFLVVEVDGQLVATTLLTFPRVSAYVSNVVVDPAHRRRGYAKSLLEEARQAAKRAGRQYLALDVLDTNTGARALYESIGYRALRAKSHMVLDPTGPLGPSRRANPAIRPFRRTDARALAALVREQTPEAVEAVLPTGESAFATSGFTNRILASEEAAWVIDRGAGAEGHVAATVSAATTAAHMTAPVLSSSLDVALGETLVRTATAWCAARQAPRILSLVAEHNMGGRTALEAVGFRHALSTHTLYRPVD
ncbi:MAG: GNAT family N-acetyltransferase [Thermoplasmata archaeon]